MLSPVYVLRRYYATPDESHSVLLRGEEWISCILEDESRTVKLSKETRVPAGEYFLGLRRDGGMSVRYDTRYRDILPLGHIGMLCAYNHPNWILGNAGMQFQYCYFHIGNTDDDTAGCFLVGNKADVPGKRVLESSAAYQRVYPIIIADIMGNASGYPEDGVLSSVKLIVENHD
mgnify:CR=1 FL=1